MRSLKHSTLQSCLLEQFNSEDQRLPVKLQQQQQQYDSSLNNKIPWTKNRTQKCGFKDRTSNSGFGLQFYSSYKYNPNANLLGACTEIQSLYHTPPVATLNSLKKLKAGMEAECLLIKQYSKHRFRRPGFTFAVLNFLCFYIWLATIYQVPVTQIVTEITRKARALPILKIILRQWCCKDGVKETKIQTQIF